MEKKTRPVSIRLLKSQDILLTEVLVKEQRNKSELIRDALNKYLVENIRKDKINTNNGNNNSTHDKS